MSLFGTVERFGGGDDSWLGSRHAVENAESGTLNADAFDVDNDIVASGYPVQPDGDGLYEPFSGGPGLRFAIGDHSIAEGNKTVALLWHGRIKPDNLPVDEFDAPAGTQFTFVGVNPTSGGGDNGNGEGGDE